MKFYDIAKWSFFNAKRSFGRPYNRRFVKKINKMFLPKRWFEPERKFWRAP